VANKRKRQIFGEMKGIHSRVKYLRGKRELRKCEKSSRRIREKIPVRYGRYKKTRKRRGNI